MTKKRTHETKTTNKHNKQTTRTQTPIDKS